MGQKTHPYGFRLGITKPWLSRWYTEKDYAHFVAEDSRIRLLVKKRLYSAGVSRVEIERRGGVVAIKIYTARPGLVIGKKGTGIDALKIDLAKDLKKEIDVSIHEVRKAELDAQLVAENIAMQLERRVAFRRAMKKAVTQALKLGALGIKVKCGGRLAGAEIARKEWYREGRVPLHTLRADIDYGQAEALTTYGKIGVKCWIYKGDVFGVVTHEEAQGA
ncbi:MAG: 30S ribosomal protein S3 [Deltaproteobacteria bacterium]|nr:30S ribosomal protein S3 [Deltaproteobacteria bacterium]MBI2500321.1 30S ribosomal protein S3 [Deltaproteobacteria bacterium]MBI4196473.1 30S ribosomal protein S3 [Deltaproteobacteria bacterium]